MALELLERPTNARAPMRRQARPTVQTLVPLYHHGSYRMEATIGSTSTGYDAVYIDAGTLADPTCRIYLPASYPARTSAHDVLEIRFLSGLTWEELGELFGVSRRSVHNWANGEALKPDNLFLVANVLHTIKELHRPSSTETRLALLSPLPAGRRALDLLKAARWDEAVAAVKALPSFSVPASEHPDSAQLHPTAYLGALGDSPGPTSGRLVDSRRMRRPAP